MLLEPLKHQLVTDDLASPPRKKKFRVKPTPFQLNSTDTEFSERKNCSPIICKLDTPVSNEVVENLLGKEFGADFDVVIDKPSKQESLHISKNNCPVNVVKQNVKHFDEQINARKEIHSTLTADINNASNNSAHQNNEERTKGTKPILF